MSRDECQEINPAKFEKCEDMSSLTFLNEASVLHNLRQRYASMMIYTYSGLFCVFINPYKMLPIYTDSVINMYNNKRRSEMPPHLFAVSDEAYRNMLTDKQNQSMLITGESGAGKTENTKKVISYFAHIGGAGEKKSEGGAKKTEPSLENQVVQANPAIEAFGNGATTRNYNSSRYGKFIRIHFDGKGKLCGGDIEHYLLEKSRVIKQAPGERSYHIFYQIMTQKKLRDDFGLDEDIRKYNFVSQAEITVPHMDDKEEWTITDNAFDVMGFSSREKTHLYRTCAGIMCMGEMRFKQKPREEQAEVDGMDMPSQVARLFGVEVEQFLSSLTRPRVRVGGEWVAKGQTLQQVDWAVGALAKAVYARMFTWLINRCNKTLASNIADALHYIGVLDIAGFEIFDRNSFEQLWINFVNEKLQQFFNHHMFVLEQEEYKREGIEWTFIDFGLDLQACIDLIEKPLGMVSMLDEECIVPKATDSTFVDKLLTQHSGKHPNFQKAKPPKGKQAMAHFSIVHYAGTVRYNAEQWLDKNKDPLNDSAVACLKTADKESLIFKIWEDYTTEVDREAAAARGKQAAKKKGKSASFMTVSCMYRESLSSLMSMLHTTHPHFIRCIIPNEKKTSGLVDAPLVLNQLTCNGVLEGIRICRKGFPNRMLFADFKYRYAILAADEARSTALLQEGCVAMMGRLVKEKKMEEDMFKVGETKVFFRAGQLARMEELRDEALSKMIVRLQCAIRTQLAYRDAARRRLQDAAADVIQHNVRRWIDLRTWLWFRLYSRVKPLLKGLKANAEAEILQKRVAELEKVQAMEEEARKKAVDELREKTALYEDCKGELERERMMMKKRNDEIEALNKSLSSESEKASELAKRQRDLEKERERERKEFEETATRLRAEAEADKDRAAKEAQLLRNKLKAAEDAAAHAAAQKKNQELENDDLSNQLAAVSAKADRATAERERLMQDMEQMEDKLNAERRQKDDAIRSKKKLEHETKTLRDQLELIKTEKHQMDMDCKRREQDIGEFRLRAQGDANLIAKLQASVRQMIDRMEELEELLEGERRGRQRAEKNSSLLQCEVDEMTERMAEQSGQLHAQIHLNKTKHEEVALLNRELSKKSLNIESHMADLCSMQHVALNNLRSLCTQAAALENDATRVLETRKNQQLIGLYSSSHIPSCYADMMDEDEEDKSC